MAGTVFAGRSSPVNKFNMSYDLMVFHPQGPPRDMGRSVIYAAFSWSEAERSGRLLLRHIATRPTRAEPARPSEEGSGEEDTEGANVSCWMAKYQSAEEPSLLLICKSVMPLPVATIASEALKAVKDVGLDP
jgi:hypothetical protein